MLILNLSLFLVIVTLLFAVTWMDGTPIELFFHDFQDRMFFFGAVKQKTA